MSGWEGVRAMREDVEDKVGLEWSIWSFTPEVKGELVAECCSLYFGL